MRLRRAVPLALTLGLVVTTSAYAASRPPARKVCNLVKDVAGDSDWDLAPTVSPPALDILSADVATGPTQLVGVLRLASTDTKADSYAYLGYEWELRANLGGADVRFTMARTGPTGADQPAVTIGGVRPAMQFAVVGNTFVWTVRRSEVKGLARPKQVFTTFSANSSMFGTTADVARGEEARYVDRTPSCVKAL